MRSLYFTLLLIVSSTCFAQVDVSPGIDPDLVDAEMTQVMYNISPKDMKIIAYKNGYPSVFNLKLCKTCWVKSYTLKEGAELLLNEQALLIADLTVTLIKQPFDVIQLGIDRNNQAINYLYLGGISESNTEDLLQEQYNEY